MPTFMLAPMQTTSTAATAMATLLVSSPTAMATLPIPFTTAMAILPVSSKPPSTLNTHKHMPKPQDSSQMLKPWPRPYIPIPLSALVHSDWSSEGGLGWNKAGERGDQQDYDKRMKEITRGRKKNEIRRKGHIMQI